MVSVPSQAFGHQFVPASPSIAFDAGSPNWEVSALAWPDRAQLMPGPWAHGQLRCGALAAVPAAPVVRACAAACPGNGEVPAAPPAGPADAAPTPATRMSAAGAAAMAAARSSPR